MATLKINGKEITVADGTLILDAAKEAGFDIPTFCYQAELSSLGSCRMCLIEIGGQKKLQPACITPVLSEAEIFTDSETVISARAGMLEFLLTNHSFDCPVCDMGGECELQDMVYKHGPAKGRHAEPKHKFHLKDYNLSPVIVKNSNRCVQCTRCVRVCKEVVGRGVLGSIGRGHDQEETSFLKGELDCDHCGMCIEVCPVGSLMRRPYRYKARPWDLKSAKSVCPYCATGCRITIQERDGEVVRSIAKPEDGFNGKMLCARGRFGYDFLNSDKRITSPMKKTADGGFEEISWDEATALLRDKLRWSTPERIGAIAGARLTNEEYFSLQKLMRGVLKSGNIDSSSRWSPSMSAGFITATGIPTGGVSIYDAMESDAIFVLGGQLSEENPVTDYIVRNLAGARRKAVIVASSRGMKLDASALMTLRYGAGHLGSLVKLVARAIFDANAEKLEAFEPMGTVEGFDVSELSLKAGAVEADVSAVANKLASSKTISLIVGTDFLRFSGALSSLRLLRDMLNALGKELKILPLLDRANQRGAWDMGVHPLFGPGYAKVKDSKDNGGKWMGTERMLEACMNGELDTLYVVGEDVLGMFPDGNFAKIALKGVGFLAVQASFMTPTAEAADLVLPSSSYAEKCGTMTNQEGRVQSLEVLQSPPGSAKTDLEIFSIVGNSIDASFGSSDPKEIFKEISSEVSGYADVAPGVPAKGNGAGSGLARFTTQVLKQNGESIRLEWDDALEAEAAVGKAAEGNNFKLLTGNHLFCSGRLSGRSDMLTGLVNEAIVEMSAADAERLELSAGDKVEVSGNGFKAIYGLRINDGSPKGVVFVPENFIDAPTNMYFDRGTEVPNVKVTPEKR